MSLPSFVPCIQRSAWQWHSHLGLRHMRFYRRRKGCARAIRNWSGVQFKQKSSFLWYDENVWREFGKFMRKKTNSNFWTSQVAFTQGKVSPTPKFQRLVPRACQAVWEVSLEPGACSSEATRRQSWSILKWRMLKPVEECWRSFGSELISFLCYVMICSDMGMGQYGWYSLWFRFGIWKHNLDN